MQLLHRLAAACGPGGRLLVGGRAPRHGWLRPLVIRDEYRNLIGPWGGGCRPASQPSSTLPPRPAGASSTPSRMARATGPPSLSTLHDRLPCRLRRRPGDLRSLARSSVGEPRPMSPRVGPLVAVLLLDVGICGCSTEAPCAPASASAPYPGRSWSTWPASAAAALIRTTVRGTRGRLGLPSQARGPPGPPRTRTRRWTNHAKRTSIRPGSGRCGVIPRSRWW
jgi:hypothetical protein